MSLSDAIKRSIKAFIRENDPRRDYANLYEYNVTAQSGALMNAKPAPSTKNLEPPVDLPDVFGVRMRPSITGGVATYPEGASILVGFVNGDPASPFVAFGDPDLEPDTVTMQGGANGVARKTDSVKVTITVANIATMALSNSGGPVAAANPVDVIGEITDGSSKVKVG